MNEQTILGAFLVKEGKSEKRVKEQQGPYELPEAWKWVRLGDICKINPSKGEIKGLSDNIKVTFVPMAAVSEVTGRIENPKVRLLGEVKKGYTYFKENDVLFAKITPCMENGKSAIARNLLNGLGFGSTEFHILRPLGEVIPEWIHHYVRQDSFREEAAKNMTGTVGHQRVPKIFLEKVKIPFPSLEVQKRIVARIEELVSRAEEAKRLKRIAAVEAEKIMQAALHKVFSRAEEEGWEWIELRNIAKIVGGHTPRRNVPRYWNGDIPWLTPTELPSDTIAIISGSREKITQEGLKNSSAVLIPPGSVLYTSRATIGKIAIAGVPLTTNQGFTNFICTNHLYNWYLACCLKWLTSQIQKEAGRTTFSEVRRSRLRTFKIPLPSLEEQKRIVAYLDRVSKTMESLKKLQQGTEEELEKLVPAVLDRAFRGEL